MKSKNAWIAMRQGLPTIPFVIVAMLALVHCSTANADSSFKVVTPPGEQAQAEAPVVPHSDEPLPGEPVAPGSENNNKVYISSPVVAQVVRVGTGAGRQATFSEPYSNIYTSNPAIVDVAPINVHTAFLRGRNQGTADVYFYSAKGKVTNILTVIVDDFNYSLVKPIEDNEVKSYGTIEIHNKALLDSQTNFRCFAKGCTFVGEKTVTEPAPLPRGHNAQAGEGQTALYPPAAVLAPSQPPGH